MGILANRSWSIPDFETFRFWAATGGENTISETSAFILRFFQKIILRTFNSFCGKTFLVDCPERFLVCLIACASRSITQGQVRDNSLECADMSPLFRVPYQLLGFLRPATNSRDYAAAGLLSMKRDDQSLDHAGGWRLRTS